MGEGVFDSVCDDMRFYHYTVRNGAVADIFQRQLSADGASQDEAELAKQRAFDLIQQFIEIRTREQEQSIES